MKSVEAPNGDAYIRVEVGGEKKTFSPQEIASMVLAKLKSDAESKLGETITEAVITVPAYFNARPAPTRPRPPVKSPA